MPNVKTSVLNGMLKNIKDPKLRETYAAILSGKFPFAVYCMNPQKDPKNKRKQMHPKGVLIGYIDGKGRCIDDPKADKDGRPISGIETSRDRFDGRKGFRCYCGNWSIEANEEQGIINRGPLPGPPSREDMMRIHDKLQKSKKPLGMQFINGQMEYDGFLIKEAK